MYTAPEYASGDYDLHTQKMDIFNLGCAFY